MRIAEIIAEALQLLSKRDRYQQWAIEFDPPQSPVRTSDVRRAQSSRVSSVER